MRVMLYEAAQSMMHSKKWFLAQGLSHANRQAPRDGRSSSMKTVQDQTR
jgi:hypothetical protein